MYRCRLATKIGKKMQQLQKAELAVAVKEDLKTVALGTSKINYMDPRITIAWCKRNEVGGVCDVREGRPRGDVAPPTNSIIRHVMDQPMRHFRNLVEVVGYGVIVARVSCQGQLGVCLEAIRLPGKLQLVKRSGQVVMER